MVEFIEELEKAIMKRKAIVNGYRFLLAINPVNKQIIEDYKNRSDYHRKVIEDAIKNGEV